MNRRQKAKLLHQYKQNIRDLVLDRYYPSLERTGIYPVRIETSTEIHVGVFYSNVQPEENNFIYTVKTNDKGRYGVLVIKEIIGKS